jgi:hypothetical protein
MLAMGIRADVSAYLMQKLAPRRVDYGTSLYFSGTDLPGPHRIRVPTRDRARSTLDLIAHSLREALGTVW